MYIYISQRNTPIKMRDWTVKLIYHKISLSSGAAAF